VEKQSLPLSPNNTITINTARGEENKNGHKIKVIVGSQVAGEGVDLRFIREVHILEGWFHLSKEEQIVGRGIRYCSHNALPRVKRNCTINLYVNTFPNSVNKETIDLYSYRTAMNKATRVGNVSRALKMGAADCNLNRDAILVEGLTDIDMLDSQGQPRRVNLNDRDFTPACDWITCSYECEPSIDLSGPDDNGTYDMFAARFAEQRMINKLKGMFKDQPWFQFKKIQEIFKDIPKGTLISLLLRVVNNQSIVFENGNLQGHVIYRNGLFLFQPNKIQDNAIPISFRYGRYPVRRDYYQPGIEPVKAAPKADKAVVLSSVDEARKFWTKAVDWVDSWCKKGSIQQSTSSISDTILSYVEGDSKKKENFESRMKMLQWWGNNLKEDDEFTTLKKVSLEYIWDSFLKGPDQAALLTEGISSARQAGSEQILNAGSIDAVRYMDMITKEPVYQCSGQACPPSVIKIFTDSKVDPVVTARANSKASANPYGFMVIWENDIMFKTNNAKNAEGKPPGPGAACSIVSTVKAHRKKILELDKDFLSKIKNYDLTEKRISEEITGAPSICALMEIIMRWMDLRKESYRNKRFFYRPLSSYYSGHKSKK
jgi:hypothetical protein